MLVLSFVMAMHSFVIQNAYGSEIDSSKNATAGNSSPSAANGTVERIVVSREKIKTMNDGDVCPGAEVIKGHYTTRRDDFNAEPARDAKTLASTNAIIDCLSNPEMLAKRLANMDAKKIMVKAVMATAFIHDGQKKIENPVQKGDFRYAHYLVLERIENLSILLSKQLNLTVIDGNSSSSVNSFDVNISEAQWNAHNVIETLAKINQDTFTAWFNEALVEHNQGLLAKAAFVKGASEKLLRDEAENMGQDRGRDATLHAVDDTPGSSVNRTLHLGASLATPVQEEESLIKKITSVFKLSKKSSAEAKGTNLADGAELPISYGQEKIKAHVVRKLTKENMNPNLGLTDEVLGKFKLDVAKSTSTSSLVSAVEADSGSVSAVDTDSGGVIDSFVNSIMASLEKTDSVVELDRNDIKKALSELLVEALLIEDSTDLPKIKLLTSILGKEICIWQGQGSAISLSNIFKNGRDCMPVPDSHVDVDYAAVLCKIKAKDAGLIHLYCNAENYYLLTLGGADAAKKQNTNHSFFKSIFPRFFIGGLTIGGVGLFIRYAGVKNPGPI